MSTAIGNNITFVTGTRADYGKLKPLMREARNRSYLRVTAFVTGMHLLARYGSTVDEVRKDFGDDLFSFINQNHEDSMDAILGKTILGFSDFVKEEKPDVIIVHGDRVEALACAAVGALSNIRVVHVEGGELSGTIDESLRHAISKLAHVHLVANDSAAATLLQLGEIPDSIHVIGSPELDMMSSEHLPSLQEVMSRYEIPWAEYAIAIYHPVTTDTHQTRLMARAMVEAILVSNFPHIVVLPNNDSGANIVLKELDRLNSMPMIRTIPSIRFEYYLSLLKSAKYIIGNSSSGVREAPYLGVPSISLGNRQKGRSSSVGVHRVEDPDVAAILQAMNRARRESVTAVSEFGDGRSAERFGALLDSGKLWSVPIQKQLERATSKVIDH